MKLKITLLALTFSTSSAVFAQNLQGEVQEQRNKYDATVTASQVVLILDTVAWNHRTEGWGLLLKPEGYGIDFLGRQIAGDILFNSATSRAYDVLSDQENTAGVTWRDVGIIELTRFQPPVDPSLLGGVSVPTVPSVPSVPAGNNLSEVLIRLDRLEQQIAGTQGQNERIFDNSTSQRTEIKSMVTSLSDQLAKHDERVGAIEKIFKSWQTYIITAAPFLGYYLPKLGNSNTNTQAQP